MHTILVNSLAHQQTLGAMLRHLVPVLGALLPQFPFVVNGFHADNGSEYVNHRVAALLGRLHIGKFTRSRARRFAGLVNAFAQLKSPPGASGHLRDGVSFEALDRARHGVEVGHGRKGTSGHA